MGLSMWLRQRAAIAPLVVTVPGGTAARLAVEQAIREVGWCGAESPAAAGLLVVAGPTDDAFDQYVTRVWDAMPEPKVRVHITEFDDVAEKLGMAATLLRSGPDYEPITAARADESRSGAEDPEKHGHNTATGVSPRPIEHTSGAHAEHSQHPPSTGDTAEPRPGGNGEHEHGAHRGPFDAVAHEPASHGEHGAADADGPATVEEHGGGQTDPPTHVHSEESTPHGHDANGTAGSEHDHLNHAEHQGHDQRDGGGHGDGHDQHMGGGHGHHHGGHGHDMGMPLPGGLAMADRGPDRDGLQLDVLNVALGPAIRWWPAGLVMTTRWQGDVVSDAAVSVLPLAAGIEPFWLRPWLRAGRGERVNAGEAGRWQAARRLDSAATLLAIAGWDDAATAAHRLRDRLLSGEPSERDAGQLSSWIRRVVGSRVLRWSLREVGRIGRGPNVPATVIGDAHDRFLTSVAALADADHRDECLSKPEGFISDEVERNRWIVDALPGLLVGAELEEARLIVASLDPDVELVCWATAATKAAHG